MQILLCPWYPDLKREASNDSPHLPTLLILTWNLFDNCFEIYRTEQANGVIILAIQVSLLLYDFMHVHITLGLPLFYYYFNTGL